MFDSNNVKNDFIYQTGGSTVWAIYRMHAYDDLDLCPIEYNSKREGRVKHVQSAGASVR
jgi:hypothetical protein